MECQERIRFNKIFELYRSVIMITINFALHLSHLMFNGGFGWKLELFSKQQSFL